MSYMVKVETKEYYLPHMDWVSMKKENFDESLPRLIMTVGLPGSGKSTWAREYGAYYAIVSSDAIRAELYGDENDQCNPHKVFEVMKQRARDYLKAGQTVIYDATNLSAKKRANFLKTIADIPCVKVARTFVTPFEVCVMRRQKAERKVSREVIERMVKQFEFPWWDEGWDWLIMERNFQVDGINYEFDLFDQMEELRKIPHDSPYHPESIGEHCWNVGESPLLTNEFERSCGYAHDIGKAFCKVFTNAKGTPTEYAHFYGHECVSAYFSVLESETSFMWVKDRVKKLYERAVVIQNHMKRYSLKDAEKISALYGRMGYLGSALRHLNEADESCVTYPE